MSVFPVNKSLKIPEAEDNSPKEVFSFFGLCMYNVQVFERGIINLTVGLRVKNLTRLNPSDIDHMFDEEGVKILGQLIADLRRRITVSADLEESLIKARNDRNYIAHRYFYHHSNNFLSDSGRSEMISELRDLIDNFQSIDINMDRKTHQLWEEIGITEEMVETELTKMKREANKRDTTS